MVNKMTPWSAVLLAGGMCVMVPAPVMAAAAAPLSDAHDVLFITLDDFRPELPVYGREWLHTPGLTSIADRGTTFLRAYVQAPQCCPTRNSFLTGRRPDNTRVFTNGELTKSGVPTNMTSVYFRDALLKQITIPEAFKQAGYYVTGGGKVFHPGNGMAPGDAGESLISYTDPYFFCLMGWNAQWTSGPTPLPPNRTGCVMSTACRTCLAEEGTLINATFGKSYHVSHCPDDCFVDSAVAEDVARRIRAHSAKESESDGPRQPMFTSLGMRNPHLPWFVPQKYFDFVDAHIPASDREAKQWTPPTGALASGDPYDNFEFWLMTDLDPIQQNVSGFPEVPTSMHFTLRKAYWAALMFTDTQIVKVLQALEDTGTLDSTIIVVVGDHGYGLSELGAWGKYTLLEQGTRAPMLIAVPGLPQGQTVSIPVEFVDVAPTLFAVAGLSTMPDLDGKSLFGLLQDNSTAVDHEDWVALSQYPAVHRVRESDPFVMGASMRTLAIRFTAWCTYDYVQFVPDFDRCRAFELYNYTGICANCVDDFDLINLAAEPANAELVQQLLLRLRRAWSPSLQPNSSTA
eukprot:m.268329 g.268329  ORF g.268329 m.268329 type:complete len:572 (+) comp26805_c0_seq1:138-1853(+)